MRLVLILILAATLATVIALTAGAVGLGGQAQVSEMDGSDPLYTAEDAVAVHNPQTNRTIVAWVGDDPSNGDQSEEDSVWVRFLDAGGTPVGAQKRISDPGNPTARFARSLEGAYNVEDNRFILVWSGGTGTDEDIVVQQLDASLNEVGPDDAVVTAGVDNQSPSVAYNPPQDEYVVVYDDNLGSQVLGQRLTRAGAETGTDDFAISDGALDADRPDVAYNATANQYLVAWEHQLPVGQNEIFGQRLDAAGAQTGANDFQISQQTLAGTPRQTEEPDVAWSATDNEYLVVWEGDRLFVPAGANEDSQLEEEAFGQRLSAAGAALGGDFRITSQGGDGNAAVDANDVAVTPAPGSNRYMVAWNGDVTAAGDREAFARCLGAGGALGPAFRLSTHGVDGNASFDVGRPFPAFNPASGAFLVAWPGSKQAELEIFARRADCAASPQPPATSQRPLTLAELNAQDPPTRGKDVNVGPVRGKVYVAVAGARATRRGARASLKVPGIKGREFVPLTQARQIPVGSLLDTRRGTVRIFSARDAKGRQLQSGDFSAGVFQVLQSRKASVGGLTELRLKGLSFRGCGASRARAARKSRRTIRRLKSTAKGRFRTRGRYSSATVRGTKWDTTDRCDGTLTRVRSGRVAVRDLRRKRTIHLRRGKRYLARAPGG